jgi:NarL family two-component system response regulator LiaR
MADANTTSTRITVVIVDDHELVRSGLESVLSLYDDLELVGEARSGEAAVALCAAKHPDVVLMDLIMRGMDGVAATEQLLRRSPGARVLVLTSFSDSDLIERALRAGAIGYLLKSVSGDELAAAIRRAYAGLPTLAPEAAQVLIDAVTTPASDGVVLTAREREVLSLLTEGLTNAEIAARLFVSLSTVKTHVSSIIAKLGAATRTEAATIAVREHLV